MSAAVQFSSGPDTKTRVNSLNPPRELNFIGNGVSVVEYPDRYDIEISGAGVGLATTTVAGIVELATDGENAANVVVQGNDSRLSNTRTPTSHASTHKSGGSDPIKLDELAAPTDINTLNADTSKHGLMRKLSGTATEYYDGSGNWSTPATGSGGEANTYSNAGLAGIPIILTKTGFDLPFKAIDAASTKVSVANDTVNKTVDIDVVEGNLTLSNMGGSISSGQAAANTVFTTTNQTLTNKTFSLTDNTVTATSAAAGDLIEYDGSKYNRFPRGSANQVLAVNGAGSDIAWTTPTTSSPTDYVYSYFVYKSGVNYIVQTGNGVSPAGATSYSTFQAALAAIVSAISPAGTPTLIRIGAGDFDLASQFAIPTSAVGNIAIDGMGIGITNIIVTSAWNGITLGTQAIKIGALPTISAGITGTLTANCVLNSISCTVSTADAAKFSVGDYVLLTSTLAWSTAPSAGTPQAEMKRLVAVNTGTGVITFDVPTFDTYNTANTAVIYRLANMLSNIKLSNLTIKKGSGLNTDTGNTTGVVYLTASCVDNLQIDNCQFIDPVTNFDACCNLKSCINSEINNTELVMNPSQTYNDQYGIAIGTCSQNIIVSNCRAIGAFRHPFEGANDSSSSGWQGVARNVTFANCTVEGGVIGAFDTHVGGELIAFVNCKVLGTTQTTGNVGFEIRTRKTQLIGCSVEGAETYGFQFSGDAHDGIVSGCIGRSCGGGGNGEAIRLINDMAGIKRTTIIGCTFNDSGRSGIRLDSGCDYTKIIGCTVNGNANNGMYLKDSDYLIVSNNTVTGNSSSGIWLDPATLTLSNCQIVNNTTTGNGSPQIKTTTSATGSLGANNIINDNIGFASPAVGAILKSNGTTLQPLLMGTANQVLAVNSTATDVAWTSLNSETTGTATGTANGSSTVFTITHGLGTTPYMALVICSSHDKAFTYTYNSTQITVTFTTAPPASPSTVTFQYRVVA